MRSLDLKPIWRKISAPTRLCRRDRRRSPLAMRNLVRSSQSLRERWPACASSRSRMTSSPICVSRSVAIRQSRFLRSTSPMTMMSTCQGPWLCPSPKNVSPSSAASARFCPPRISPIGISNSFTSLITSLCSPASAVGSLLSASTIGLALPPARSHSKPAFARFSRLSDVFLPSASIRGGISALLST